MSVQPIDIGEVSFRLVFLRTGEVLDISEPDGWEDVKIKLRGKNYARMIDFDDEFTLKFFKGQGIERGYDRLVEEFEQFGYESDVNLEVMIDSNVEFQGELHFEKIKWNAQKQEVEIPVESYTIEKDIKRLEDTAVNLLTEKTLTGKNIDPLPMTDVVLRAKEILERSIFEIGDVDGNSWDTWYSQSQISGNNVVGSNYNVLAFPFGKLLTDQSGSANSYSFFGFGGGNPDPSHGGVATGFQLDDGDENLINNNGLFNIKTEVQKKVIINTPELVSRYYTENGNSSSITFLIGQHQWNSEFTTITSFNTYVIPTNNTSVGGNIRQGVAPPFEVEIDLQPYSTLTIYARLSIGGRLRNNDYWEVDNAKINFDAVDVFPDTTCKMARLIDVGKKIIENYTDGKANVIAPLFEVDNTFYTYYLTNGYFIRGFEDRDFVVSWKEWKSWVMKAFNCDVEYYGNNVFVGRHEQFYNDIEMLRLPYIPNVSDFEIKSDPEREYNLFRLEYENYEDDDKNNTLDAFHTEIETRIPNLKISKTKEVKLPFTADNYSIEYARREGVTSEPTTAKVEDDNIYIIDVVENNRVLMNRTTEGFDFVNGVFSPATTGNYRLSLKRLIYENYKYWISEAAQNNTNVYVLTVQYFKSNNELRTSIEPNPEPALQNDYKGIIYEAASVFRNIFPEPLINNTVYDITYGGRVKWETFIDLKNKINTLRGYITFYDDLGNEVKVYPHEGTAYEWNKEMLKIVGKRKK